MSTDVKPNPLPGPPANDNAETLGQILAELRSLRTVVEAQHQELLDLRRGLAAPPSVSMPVEDAARVLGCGKTRVFALLRNGTLERGKSAGRRTMVTRGSLEAFLRAPRSRSPWRASSRRQARTAFDSVQDAALAIRALPT